MKNFSLLSVVIAGLLMVTVLSCTPMYESTRDDDGYYTETRRRAPSRILVDDPYAGTVILQRDPWTGRYYQVSPYGYYSPYGYNSPYYDRGWNNPYNSTPRHQTQPRSGYNQPQQPQRPSQQNERAREEARDRIRKQ